MLFTPLITLDLVTAARRMRYFIVRVLYAAILFLLLCSNYAGSELAGGDTTIRAVAHFSANFFIFFSVAQITAILLLTPAMIAGTIAQERERRTIEYLFASTLGNGEIILSKFLARVVHVASMLLVGLPILAVTMMLGGVDPEILLIVFLLSLGTLLATAALSMAVSVWAKRSRDAVVRTYVFLVAFLAVPAVVYALRGIPGWSSSWLNWLFLAGEVLVDADPYVALFKVFGGRFGASASPWQDTWPLLVGYVVFSLLALAWSIAAVRRVYRKSVGVGEGPRRDVLARFRWRPAVGNRPMLWKELFAATAAIRLGILGRIVAMLIVAAFLAPMVVIVVLPWNSFHELAGRVAAYVGVGGTMLECGALLIIAVRAAGAVTAEKERDTWVALVSTSLSPSEIVWAKIAGAVYAARWFLLPLGLVWLLLFALSPSFGLILPVKVAVFACCAMALAAMGTWFSTWTRTSIRAMGATIGVSLFAGGGYLLCCSPLAFLARGGGEAWGLMFAPCIPFLLGYPTFFWERLTEPHARAHSFASYEVVLMVAFVVGVVGYFFVGMAIAAATIGSFDALSGRAHPRQGPLPPRPIPPPPSPPIVGPEPPPAEMLPAN